LRLVVLAGREFRRMLDELPAIRDKIVAAVRERLSSSA
jgi:hypothetical protein